MCTEHLVPRPAAPRRGRGIKTLYIKCSTRTNITTNEYKNSRILFPAGQWGRLGFNVGVFLGFVAGTLASVIESVGDYHACARTCQQRPPPAHATNRGILMEGVGCLIGGFLGAGLSVTTYSENVGVIGLTKVGTSDRGHSGSSLPVHYGPVCERCWIRYKLTRLATQN